jgi:hypothetical protein
MPRTRNPYPAEFREQIVALAHGGRSVEDLAREFEPCAATIHGWVKQAVAQAVAIDEIVVISNNMLGLATTYRPTAIHRDCRAGRYLGGLVCGSR